MLKETELWTFWSYSMSVHFADSSKCKNKEKKVVHWIFPARNMQKGLLWSH